MNTYQTHMPLRYRIANWKQLEGAKSNNSRDLSISVTTFVNDHRLNGQRIRVEHTVFGTLFACVVQGKGCLLSESLEGYIHEFTPGQILAELEKFGFLVTYDPTETMSGNQIEFLMTINKLGFDKIRVLSVWDAPLGVKEFKIHITAFNSEDNGDWMNSGYSPSLKEYMNSLSNGSAIDVTQLSDQKHYDWSWLYGWVANINDIISDQSVDQEFDEDKTDDTSGGVSDDTESNTI